MLPTPWPETDPQGERNGLEEGGGLEEGPTACVEELQSRSHLPQRVLVPLGSFLA